MTTQDTLVIRAGRLIDGTGAEPRENVTVTVENGMITNIGDTGSHRTADELDLSGYTLMPGLINMHTHTVLPGDGTSFEAWMENPDEILLLKAFANARTALLSGVTTIRDCGGKDELMFRLRDAIRAGVVEGPRFILCGYPLTITGGHCRYFGGETDGVEGMRLAAREVLKRGADFVKIMACGGGTVGTYSQFPTYEVEELKAAIDEAHKVRKPSTCHTIATDSISRALDAGTDHIEHCSFMAPDTSWQFDEVIARRVADQGVYVTPTLQVAHDRLEALMERERARHAHLRGGDRPADRAAVTRQQFDQHAPSAGAWREAGGRKRRRMATHRLRRLLPGASLHGRRRDDAT